jgi:ABC-type polysaccharide/polyol phosphate transport system ATPase subunit
MSDVTIRAEGLGKRYYIGSSQKRYDRIGDQIGDLVLTPLRRVGKLLGYASAPTEKAFWALQDVTFEIKHGEVVGIIGHNGAGKSTLLKILSRITQPSKGYADIYGRVSSLLEVGTGFHPELTGRENVYLNGAILGLSRKAINRHFDEIVAFSGVERFIDTPIKRYSTGMHLRLAFAVAAHLEPEILVVDEVLAVGDVEFQAKCLGRMASAEREGRTVVFVSHNLDAIAELCERAIWLDGGRISAIGETIQVIERYLSAQSVRGALTQYAADPRGRVSLDRVAVSDPIGLTAEIFRGDTALIVEVRFTVRAPVPGLDLSIQIVNGRGAEVLNEAWSDAVAQRPTELGEYVARLRIPRILNVGDYVVGVWLGTVFDTFLHDTATCRFRLEGDPKGRPRRVVDLRLPWDVRRADMADFNVEIGARPATS